MSVSAGGCRTVSEYQDLVIEIPELTVQRPLFPVEEFNPAPVTEADLLQNYLMLDVYIADLESYIDALERYIVLIKQVPFSNLK